MKGKRITKTIISLVLCAVMVLPFVPGVKTSALTPAQEQFLAEMSDIAVVEMERSKVLASVTVAQAIWESSWGQSTLTSKTNNYFGMTVGSSWTGMIYCSKNGSFYTNRTEAISILGTSKYNYWASGGDNGVPGFWRVYSSMEESVRDHNDLLSKSSLYAGIPGETDYKKVCEILSKYYCADGSYAEAIISTIESYELYKLDSGMVDSEVPTALHLGVDNLSLKVGETYTVNPVVSPASAKDKSVTFKSSNTAVATVSSAGVIKAVKEGTADITATTVNGITAKITVFCTNDGDVTYTAVITKSVYCRAEMLDSAQKLGVFNQGATVKIYGEAQGSWYKVSGVAADGSNVMGYIYTTCVGELTPYVPDNDDPIGGVNPGEKQYNGTITYAAKVRSEPNNTTYTQLGIFPVGTKVVVVGEKNGDFYYAIGTVNGVELKGYIYYTCVEVGEEITGGGTPDTGFKGDDGLNYRFATTTTSLNCRQGPAVTYGLLGTFAAGTKLVVCGNGVSGDGIDGVWYYVKGVDNKGNSISGYCGGDYINLGNSIFDGSKYSVTEKYIMGFSEGFTVGEASNMLAGLTVTVTNANGGNVAGTKYVGSGFILTVSYGEHKLFTKTAIVAGDIDGDGKLSANDYLRLRRYLLGIYTLDDTFTKAADVKSDGKYNASDYIALRKLIMGIA